MKSDLKTPEAFKCSYLWMDDIFECPSVVVLYATRVKPWMKEVVALFCVFWDREFEQTDGHESSHVHSVQELCAKRVHVFIDLWLAGYTGAPFSKSTLALSFEHYFTGAHNSI